MTVSIVLFTSDLRVHDHPPLRAALDGSESVVPLFVRDEAVAEAGFTAPNRMAFLADCLADLDAGLRERGGRLVVRSGDVVTEVVRTVTEADADEVHMAAGAVPTRAAGRSGCAPRWRRRAAGCTSTRPWSPRWLPAR